MNRQLLKIFTEACYHGDYEPENVPNEVVEKFAELIVQECAKSADEWYQNHNEIHWDPAQHIRNHFGVKE